MLNLTSLRDLWEARRDDLRRFHAQVDGAVLIDELLREVSSLCESQSLQPLTLAEASSPILIPVLTTLASRAPRPDGSGSRGGRPGWIH